LALKEEEVADGPREKESALLKTEDEEEEERGGVERVAALVKPLLLSTQS
jgi:hypothetical protein